ncbi:MAG: type II/IV secretion system protein, partial [Chromatiales bacterium]|nr:type II/IV secretion system protein [Chromatiales bacterium]
MAVSEAALINAGVQAGMIDAESISTLKLQARRERIRLLEAVTRAGRFPEAALYQALADLRGIPFLQMRDLKPDGRVIERLPRTLVQRRSIFPVQGNGGEYLLALSDPDDQISLDSASRAVGEKFHPALADPSALEAVVRKHGRQEGPAAQSDTGGESDSIQLFDEIMKEAYLRRASDIHFEPFDGEMRIRLRVDG